MNNIDNWYEVRADGEKVAAFAPISRDASTKAFELIEAMPSSSYWKDKVLQVVAIYTDRDWRDEEIIHEEHPTVIE